MRSTTTTGVRVGRSISGESLNLVKKIKRNSISSIGAVLGLLIFLWTGLQADEVRLKEGKVVTGTITDEDENEITMDIGHKMVLHVEKSKIESIKRDAPPTPTPALHQLPAEPVASPVNPKAGDEIQRTVQENATIINVKTTVLDPVMKE